MKANTFKTHNDIPEKARKELNALLNQQLADIIDLQTQAKQAHWNVKGPSFIALHELFDKAYEEIGEFVDEIAERIVQLGGTALGTVRISAKHSRLAEYPLEISAGHDHVEAFSIALAAYGKSVRAAIDSAANLKDADTADLFTGVSRGIDKLLWFVEAHGQSKE